ncbi:threonine--tRNA ligase [bacterium]|nr:threonine--tRNA ligase [bacterium]
MADQVRITFPDGSNKLVDQGTSPREIAALISNSLAKRTLAALLNDTLVSVDHAIDTDVSIELLDFSSPQGRDVYWHSSAHILAQAVKQLYPTARLGIGPPVEEGFYYDIEFPEPISSENLLEIEERMQKIIEQDLPIQRSELNRDDARRLFAEMDELYKVELIDDLEENAVISVYRQGDFVDLCRGPHLLSTGQVKAFKVLKIAGAYWRGEEKNKQLQRIYAVSYPDKKQLKDHIRFLEEARKRDHRKIGKELELFSFHQEGPGFPFWHPNGVIVYNQIENYWKLLHRRDNYQEVKTPIILNEELWHRSGHWDNYQENMYFTAIDEGAYAVKPMNCPGHMLLYSNSPHSYRELPLKYAELGMVHRHEKSGVLHGLFRVRQFTQDDAHIYCTPEQTEQEVIGVIELIFEMYERFGFEDIFVELSTRPEEKFIGSVDTWDRAEAELASALAKKQIEYQLNPGDGAFYGPKIDFHIRDSLRRSWQLGTIQLDFSMPERFELEYIGEDGGKHRPVMIHRAIFGSFERFIGILIEHFAGNFPIWLAPIQFALLPIVDSCNEQARQVAAQLKTAGFRVTVDERNEKIGYKIRQAEIKKIPYMGIIGEKEVSTGTVSLRKHGQGDLGTISISEMIDRFREEETSIKGT